MTREYNIKVGTNYVKTAISGTGEPFLYLHGFGAFPDFYTNLFENLSGDHIMIAPKLCGMNYFKNQPVTIEQYTDIALELSHTLGLENHLMGGHSMGAIVSLSATGETDNIKAVVAMNPAIPVEYNMFSKEYAFFEFGVRGLHICANEIAYIAKHKESKFSAEQSLNFMKNFLSDMPANIKLGAHMGRFQWSDLKKFKQPALLLFGTSDEFFTLDEKMQQEIKEKYPNIEIVLLNNRTHNWVFREEEYIAGKIRQFEKR